MTPSTCRALTASGCQADAPSSLPARRGRSAEEILDEAGLKPAELLPLDPEHGVDMRIWRARR